MPTVDLRRARLATSLELEYVEPGRGPAIVFVHGYSRQAVKRYGARTGEKAANRFLGDSWVNERG